MRGTGWYSQGIIRYAKSVGVAMKIEYQFVASRKLRKDYFVEFVKRQYECSSNPKVAKKRVNYLVGIFGKKSETVTNDTFTCSINDATRAYFEDVNATYFNYDGLFHIVTSKTTEKFENYRPIYFQVLDNCGVMLHRLASRAAGQLGRIVRLKTDAVVVEDGVELECVEGIGKYRIEELPSEFKVSKPFKNEYSFELKRLEWNPTCTEVNRLLIGKAGFGKSTVIARDTINHPSVVLLASTNKAATRLVGGQTVHNFFKMGIDNKFDKNLALKLVSKVELIVVDEISMMSSEV